MGFQLLVPRLDEADEEEDRKEDATDVTQRRRRMDGCMSNVVEFPNNELEVYGCSCECTDFILTKKGFVMCSECESTIPLMVMEWPDFVKGLAMEQSEE